MTNEDIIEALIKNGLDIRFKQNPTAKIIIERLACSSLNIHPSTTIRQDGCTENKPGMPNNLTANILSDGTIQSNAIYLANGKFVYVGKTNTKKGSTNNYTVVLSPSGGKCDDAHLRALGGKTSGYFFNNPYNQPTHGDNLIVTVWKTHIIPGQGCSADLYYEEYDNNGRKIHTAKYTQVITNTDGVVLGWPEAIWKCTQQIKAQCQCASREQTQPFCIPIGKSFLGIVRSGESRIATPEPSISTPEPRGDDNTELLESMQKIFKPITAEFSNGKHDRRERLITIASNRNSLQTMSTNHTGIDPACFDLNRLFEEYKYKECIPDINDAKRVLSVSPNGFAPLEDVEPNRTKGRTLTYE